MRRAWRNTFGPLHDLRADRGYPIALAGMVALGAGLRVVFELERRL